jgi:hypothetical protein
MQTRIAAKQKTRKRTRKTERPYFVVEISLPELTKRFGGKPVPVIIFREFAERFGLVRRAKNESNRAK